MPPVPRARGRGRRRKSRVDASAQCRSSRTSRSGPAAATRRAGSRHVSKSRSCLGRAGRPARLGQPGRSRSAAAAAALRARAQGLEQREVRHAGADQVDAASTQDGRAGARGPGRRAHSTSRVLPMPASPRDEHGAAAPGRGGPSRAARSSASSATRPTRGTPHRGRAAEPGARIVCRAYDSRGIRPVARCAPAPP